MYLLRQSNNIGTEQKKSLPSFEINFKKGSNLISKVGLVRRGAQARSTAAAATANQILLLMLFDDAQSST